MSRLSCNYWAFSAAKHYGNAGSIKRLLMPLIPTRQGGQQGGGEASPLEDNVICSHIRQGAEYFQTHPVGYHRVSRTGLLWEIYLTKSETKNRHFILKCK